MQQTYAIKTCIKRTSFRIITPAVNLNTSGQAQVFTVLPWVFGYICNQIPEKKHTQYILEDLRLTQVLSIIREYTFRLEIQNINLRNPAFLTPPFGVLSAHIAPHYRKQCYLERNA